MSVTTLAWLCAVVGAMTSCTLMIAEYLGKKTPEHWWLQVHMWGRFVLLHLAGVIWLIFTNM